MFDISNLDRLGTSEVQQVQCLVDGVKLLINMEKALEADSPIDDLLPEGQCALATSNRINDLLPESQRVLKAVVACSCVLASGFSMESEGGQEVTDSAPSKPASFRADVMSSNFPDLSTHNNWMAKCINKEIYANLCDKKTPSGFTLDNMIQTGVDNPGHPYIMTVG